MNYEFHVGDYVETVAGCVGYIKEISEKANTFTILWKNMNSKDYEQMYWFAHYSSNSRKWENDFARIGAYDFTKKEKKKIEMIDGVDITDPEDRGFIIDKINELVDAVNKLRSDYDEHIEAHRQTDR